MLSQCYLCCYYCYYVMSASSHDSGIVHPPSPLVIAVAHSELIHLPSPSSIAAPWHTLNLHTVICCLQLCHHHLPHLQHSSLPLPTASLHQLFQWSRNGASA